MTQMNRQALILFSGGVDSTTALHWARRRFDRLTALIVRYGQRHGIEVDNARAVADRLGVEAVVLDFPFGPLLSSALTDPAAPIPPSLETSRDADGVPFTYVPFRNGVFLALAAAIAESRGIYDLVTGFNAIDTPDYPDTTAAFNRKMAAAINEGTGARRRGRRFRIHSPLLALTKVEILRLGLSLGAGYDHAISCYRGAERPCGRCPSCDIRARAFAELGRPDPLIERLDHERGTDS